MGINKIPKTFHPILKSILKNILSTIKKNIVLKKLIKILICIGDKFFLAIFWLITIIVAAPIDAIKAKKTPIKFKLSNAKK